MTGLVSDGARALAAQSLGEDRVLVTGASGWLGRTALDLIAPLGLPTLALASRPRIIKVGDREVELRAWDDREVAEFAPTVVLDCAFLTRDRVSDLPLDEYVATNRAQTDRLVYATKLPGVRLSLTVSSGAAVHPQDAFDAPIEDNPYGYLKREAEYCLQEAAAKSGAVPVVLRAWSISGAHVQKPRGYALGSMIQDADAGAIRITARRPVFRRYVLAEELLALGLAEGGVGPATIDSGGELVEMDELAARVAAVVRPDAVITRGEVDPRDADRYHSDGQDWETRCQRWGLASVPLDRQIEITARGVLAR
ncbi:NAD-dependent epimerase/dehydratase family protein [Mycobacterium szulgai]|uniref:Nucleoside-diphosphate sugar epimerase n=1 Tax=Mycobacterium szulgai TaxID=1787 RepID=A0A1X2EA33_MYCSZ|nr:NAD-dependent epimerase/dehydratase family protein [Mycobacterium szulgai]MCV7074719.1 NAD(P)-dependent oxidoreductase [Mycobacterium szulgai]ORW96809.1 nucleoside-diphosphate sugar epimerase [Mycobacterium szulgai]